MPIHLAQMNQLEHHVTWKALQEGNFCVKKSKSPLFSDQALEQKIKELKGIGSIVGVTQDEVSLDRLINTLPHITSIVNDWLDGFPRFPAARHSTAEITSCLRILLYNQLAMQLN